MGAQGRAGQRVLLPLYGNNVLNRRG